MKTEDYTDIPEERVPLLRGWLYLALASLIVPGITAILLVLLRTVSAEAASGWGALFRSALVIHVDLSVFVWFVSIGGLLWSRYTSPGGIRYQRMGLLLTTAGTALVATTPLLVTAEPLLNNYIPVLNHPLFFFSLFLIWAGLFVNALAFLIHLPPSQITLQAPVQLGLTGAALSALLSIIVLTMTLLALTGMTLDHHYFERLFWGSGHILQFTYVLLLLVGWALIIQRLQLNTSLSPVHMSGITLLALLPLLTAPWLHIQHPPLSAEITVGYAQLMRYGNGLAPSVMGLVLLVSLWKSDKQDDPAAPPILNALLASLLLFAAGGILALMISGTNTIIPAHYHGSIVGITLAFMGLIYLLLPQLGFSAPSGWLARYQPMIYALGQLMHIAGLALSGSEGAQRKTAGVNLEAMNSIAEQAGVILTRSGGLVAVIGGLLFLVVCWQAIRNRG